MAKVTLKPNEMYCHDCWLVPDSQILNLSVHSDRPIKRYLVDSANKDRIEQQDGFYSTAHFIGTKFLSNVVGPGPGKRAWCVVINQGDVSAEVTVNVLD